MAPMKEPQEILTERKTATVGIDEATLLRLRNYARNRPIRITITDIVTQAVNDYLDRHENDGANPPTPTINSK